MFSLDRVTYKDILDIPHLEIPAGMMTCLFGPSGCGKTTLLRMLNGMASPDSGTVSFHGEDLLSQDLVSLRRRVVMLAQQYTVFPGTVRDNLNIGADFQERCAFSDSTLSSILDRTGLSGKQLSDDPSLFSGGEKQRLTLARVLLLSPPVLLLDEPGSALDHATETAVMDLIAEDHAERNSTCVLVTHSANMAERYADRIVYMDSGRIVRVEEKVETEE